MVTACSLHPLSEPPDVRANPDRITAAGLRETIRQCVRGEADWPLFLYGASGTGKTKACECLVKVAGGWLTTLPQLCRQLTEADRGELTKNMNGVGWKVTQTEMWQEIKTEQLLVVDEIGLRQPTDFQYDTLKRLLDWRVDRNCMATILISNLSPSGLQSGYDDRILSRITCGTVMEVVGPDLRVG